MRDARCVDASTQRWRPVCRPCEGGGNGRRGSHCRTARIPFGDMAPPHASLLLAAHAAAAEQAGPAHASLYETCAGLIVAVMVGLYFDERVRRGMTARVRGQAVGWLGATIWTGLVIPLLGLGSFIPDTARIREITAGQMIVFLVADIGAALPAEGPEET